MNSGTDPTLSSHVLVVGEDRICTCSRLLCGGYEVSTCRDASRVHQRIAQLRPDLVLIDVLTSGFSAQSLTALLSEYPAGGSPSVVLLSKVLPNVLEGLVEVSSALGIVHVTEDDAEFSSSFSDIVGRLPVLAGRRESSAVPAVSGTHLVSGKKASPHSLAGRVGGASKRR